MGSSIQVDPPLSMLMAEAHPDRPRLRSRLAALAVAAAVALLLHWMVLGGRQPVERPAPRAVEAVTVRTLDPPAPVVPVVAAAPVAAPAAKPRPRAVPRPRVIDEAPPAVAAAGTTAVDVDADAVLPVAA